MASARFEISKAASFDAAHFLPQGPIDSPYRRLHGHSFRVEASVRGTLDPEAQWVADLGRLDAALKALAGALDHNLLNEQPGLETPTLERLCLWFAERLKNDFPGLSKVALSRPTIGERCVLSLD